MLTKYCELSEAEKDLCDRVYSSLWLLCVINHRIGAYIDAARLILSVAMCMI